MIWCRETYTYTHVTLWLACEHLCRCRSIRLRVELIYFGKINSTSPVLLKGRRDKERWRSFSRAMYLLNLLRNSSSIKSFSSLKHPNLYFNKKRQITFVKDWQKVTSFEITKMRSLSESYLDYEVLIFFPAKQAFEAILTQDWLILRREQTMAEDDLISWSQHGRIMLLPLE